MCKCMGRAERWRGNWDGLVDCSRQTEHFGELNIVQFVLKFKVQGRDESEEVGRGNIKGKSF